MTTGVTITGNMLSASLASLEAKLSQMQREKIPGTGDFSDFFAEAQVKNEIAAEQYAMEEGGVTADAERKKATAELALNYTAIKEQHAELAKLDYSDTGNLYTLSDKLNNDAYWEYLQNNPKKKEELGMQVAAGILEDGVVDAEEQKILDENPRLNEVYEAGIKGALKNPEKFIEEYGQEVYDNVVAEAKKEGTFEQAQQDIAQTVQSLEGGDIKNDAALEKARAEAAEVTKASESEEQKTAQASAYAAFTIPKPPSKDKPAAASADEVDETKQLDDNALLAENSTPTDPTGVPMSDSMQASKSAESGVTPT